MQKILIGIIAVVVIVGIFLWSGYNRLVTANANVDIAWSQVETQLQRRFDLVPNLVESVQGAQLQEQTIFSEIADARTRYAGANTTEGRVQAANQLETSLGRLLVIVENYPTLTSTETVKNLMIQLEGTENRIAVERGRYNESAGAYNILTRRFPTNMLAGLFGFEGRSLFTAIPEANEAPRVDLTE